MWTCPKCGAFATPNRHRCKKTMTPPRDAGEIARRIELEALICEREGMIAENLQREHLGKSMAYDEVDFLNLGDKFRALSKEA